MQIDKQNRRPRVLSGVAGMRCNIKIAFRYIGNPHNNKAVTIQYPKKLYLYSNNANDNANRSPVGRLMLSTVLLINRRPLSPNYSIWFWLGKISLFCYSTWFFLILKNATSPMVISCIRKSFNAVIDWGSDSHVSSERITCPNATCQRLLSET